MSLFDFVRNIGRKIFDSDAVTKDPNLIFPGQKIRIPAA